MAANGHSSATLAPPPSVEVPTEPRQNRSIGFRAFIGTGVTSVFMQACTVLQGILLARLLGPTGRGELAAVILWPNIFAGIGSFGSNIALSRIVARGEDTVAVTRAAIVMGLATASVTTLVCYLMLPVLLPADQRSVLPIANLYLLYILVNHVGQNLLAIDQGTGNFRRFNVARMLLYPVNLLLIVLAAALGFADVLPFAVALLVANTIAVVYRLYLALRHITLIGTLYSPIQVMVESLRFGVARIVETLYLYADKALLLWLLDVRELGLYTAALAASGVINSLAKSSGLVVFTIAAQSESRAGFQRVAETFRAMVLMWASLGTGLLLAMPYLLPLVFGRAYAGAVVAAMLLIPGSALAGLSLVLEQSMRGQGRPFAGVEARIAGLVVMTSVAYFGSSYWGISGVCFGVIAAQAMGLTVMILHVRHHYGAAFAVAHLIPTGTDVRRLAGRAKHEIAARRAAWQKNGPAQKRSMP